MTDQAKPTPRPWRRYLRFSVRRLIVLVLVIGAGLGWFVHEAQVQRDAVAVIKRAGGSVSYDWAWKNGSSVPGGKPWAPRWLVDLVGVDYFGHVTIVVSDPGARSTDATLAQIGRLTQLEVLDLPESSISDAGLAHLKGLTNLSVLGLADTQVTDAGLAQLKGLTKLSSLWLDGTHVTDVGVKELTRALPGLTIYQ
jgi:hypothetical protein